MPNIYSTIKVSICRTGIFVISSPDSGNNIFVDDNPMNLSSNRAGFSSFEPDIAASDDTLFIAWSSAVEGLVDREEIIFKKIET